MTYDALFKDEPLEAPVPPPPSDDDNPALIDAKKTFKITVVSAVLFVLAALFIILRTRM